MKINEFINESTTAGAIATVATPMTTQKRNDVGKGVYGNEKAGNLLTGKKTNKKYANSISESKMKQVAMDLETMQDGNFKQKYKKTKEQIMAILGTPSSLRPKSKNEVNEAQLDEEDLIIVPGQGRVKGGFIPHAEDRRDHEVEMARGDLFQAYQNAEKIHKLIKDVTEDEGLEGWVQAKITKAADYLNSVRQYLEGKHVQEMTGGVVAGGGVGEGIADKIKGAVRREKAKDMPLVQTRRDYAMGKAGDAYNKGEIRKGNQYSAYAEKDRKKKGDPTTNPAGTYRTKTSDYTNEAQMPGNLGKGEKWFIAHRVRMDNYENPWTVFKIGFDSHNDDRFKELVKYFGRDKNREVTKVKANSKEDALAKLKGKVNEAQSMGTALKNTLAKAEPGSKLDNSIKNHNRDVKNGGKGTLKNAPTGYHFDSKGYCRLGDK